jgi:hypothetical protein
VSALREDLASQLDPCATFRAAFHAEPFAWQVRYLRTTGNVCLVKGRQIGASTAAAALLIAGALHDPGSLGVVLSPTQRQSAEIAVKVRAGLSNLDRVQSLAQDNVLTVGLSNGSRILSLSGSATGARGYTAAILLCDEAAYIDAETLIAASALVATGGRTIWQSTPAGRSGLFYEAFTGDDPAWTRLRVRSDEVPSISPGYLEQARRTLGPWAYSREHLAEFGAGGTSVFSEERLLGMINTIVPPLFPYRQEGDPQ